MVTTSALRFYVVVAAEYDIPDLDPMMLDATIAVAIKQYMKGYLAFPRVRVSL